MKLKETKSKKHFFFLLMNADWSCSRLQEDCKVTLFYCLD